MSNLSNTRDDNGVVVVPERRIPVPTTISPQAQAFFSAPPTFRPGPEPELEDKAGWRQYIGAMQAEVMAHVSRIEPMFPARIETVALANANLYVITPDGLTPEDEDRAILYVHGGGFIVGGDRAAAIAALPLACTTRCKIYSIDYRMLPDHAFPHMREQGGKIINLGSVYGDNVHRFVGDYDAATEGLKGLTRSAAAEWGQYDILVNLLVATVDNEAWREHLRQHEAEVTPLLNLVPLRRMGDPEEDIGGAALFLASDLGSYISGHVVHADGGYHMAGPAYSPRPSSGLS